MNKQLNTMKNKNYIIILILAVIIIIASLYLFKLSANMAPVIRFIDENNMTVNGIIYLDDVDIGKTINGEFKNLPRNYCKTAHNLALETADAKFEWASYPIDCSFRTVDYVVKIETTIFH